MKESGDRSLQKIRRSVLVATWVSVFLLVAAAGIAQDAQPIVAPATITEPGNYVLQRSGLFIKAGSAPAVTIRGRDITLDLNGMDLSGPGNKLGIGVSIEGSMGVALRNGMVSGFGIGVQVVNSNNVRIERLQIQGRDLGGAPPDIEIGVLLVNARAVVVRDNTVSRTFLGIFVRGGSSGGNRIVENTLVGDQNGMLGICYNPAMGEGPAAPKGDLVSNNLISRFATGMAMSADTSGNVFRDNTIAYRQQAMSNMAVATANILQGNLTVQLP